TDFLGAERALRIERLDEKGMHLGRLERRRALVLEHRGDAMHAQYARPALAAELLLLHQRLAESHVDAALDLSFDQHWIQRATDVVCQPHPLDGHPACLRVDVNLDYCRRVAVGRARAYSGAFERTAELGRPVTAR